MTFPEVELLETAPKFIYTYTREGRINEYEYMKHIFELQVTDLIEETTKKGKDKTRVILNKNRTFQRYSLAISELFCFRVHDK